MKIKRIFQLNGNQIEELEGKTFSISEREWGLLNVYDVEKTWFDGFGGAITQSSAYNFSLLPEEEQNKVLELLVGKSGLRYKKFRLCIGSSDFATHSYCYVKDDDFDLSSFSIKEDKKEIIPFIKRLMDYASEDLSFFASSWSCPSFMKDNNDRLHGGHLKLEFYDLYAEYIVKFLLAYREEGIKISGVTIQNEPKASQTWESCVFTAQEEAVFGKVLKKHLLMHGLGEIKLYCWDHNKERLVDRACETFSYAPEVFDGAAFHWYSGDHFEAIDVLRFMFPDIEIFESEYCLSNGFDETSSNFANEIINNIRFGVNSIVEWNVLLDENGGPYHNRGKYKNAGCEAPIKIDSKERKAHKGSTYKATYMFSHFVERGAKILRTSSFDEKVKVVAFKNPNGEIVVCVLNEGEEKDVRLFIKGSSAPFQMPKKSITSIIID